jgi:hypothetical protein
MSNDPSTKKEVNGFGVQFKPFSRERKRFVTLTK